MDILLHICCAPCAIFPVEELKQDGHNITGYFYNPNIHPYSEYLKRKAVLDSYFGQLKLNIIYAAYDIEKYFRHIAYNEASPKRCRACWQMRMDETARFAEENGQGAFTTTLLGSPYQDHDMIKDICEAISKKSGATFYYEDFRIGFKKAHDEASSMGIYCQNYCGCVFSEKERIEKKR